MADETATGAAGAATTQTTTQAEAGAGNLVAGAQAGQTAGATTQQTTQQQAAAYYPDGLPEPLRGKSDKDTIDALWKAQAAAPKPPATPAEYKLELPQDLAGVIDPANDKVLPVFQNVAHKLGLSPEQYQGVVVELHREMAKAGLLSPKVDPQAEYAVLGEGGADRSAQIAKGRERAAAIADAFDGLVTRSSLTKEQAGELIGGLGTAKSIVAMEKLLALLPKEHGVQNGAAATQANGSVDTDEQAMLQKLYPTMKVVGR